jgi:CBS domain-containing protein
MSTRLITADPGDSVEMVAGTMVDHGVHRILVTDSGGGLLGLVSALDLVRLVREFGLRSH